MKKIITILLIVLTILTLTVFAVACGEKNEASNDTPSNETSASDTQTETPKLLEFTGLTLDGQTLEYDGKTHSLSVGNLPEGANVTYSQSNLKTPGEYSITATVEKEGYKTKTLSSVLNIQMPSAKTIVKAREKAVTANTENYDFNLNLTGNVNLYGYNAKGDANYQGQYRLNKSTGKYTFARTTSGLLLADATEYIYNQDEVKMWLKTNKDGVVKKAKIAVSDDEELSLINLPIVSIINALKENNLTNIQLSTERQFQASLTLDSDDALLKKALSILGKQGSKISFKGASFTNPVGGFTLYFDLDENMSLTDFSISMEVSVPVQGVKISLKLTYEQHSSDTQINVPEIDKIYYGSAISSQLKVLNDALTEVNTNDAYSLDVLAKNQFDPGWNVTATTDKYSARFFKNTYKINDEDFVAFNHSYEYKTHHETDDKETYKYTVGNVTEDGSVYMISRKGSNKSELLENVTVNSIFDYLTSVFYLNDDEVDCITAKTNGQQVIYTVYLKSAATVDVNKKVISLINSNQAEGVIKVDNYFNESEYNVNESSLIITLNGGKLVSIVADTNIDYTPTQGDYSDRIITLDNELTLSVNENLSKAKEYTAPEQVNSKLTKLGLNNTKYYIN